MNSRFHRASFLPLAALLPLGACGDDKDPSPTTDVSADTTPGDTTPDDTTGSDTVGDATSEGCLAAAPADLAGSWAIEERQTALVTGVPGIGTMNQVSTSLYRATITGDATAGYAIEVELCDWATADDSKLTTTGMSQAVIDSLETFTRTITLADVGGEARFTTSQGINLRGVTMEDADTETFPTAKDDSRIFDQDGDEKPGITLVISGLFQGELHVIHRHRASLDGCFYNENDVRGLTTWTTEQLILGANPAELENIQPVAQTHPDPALSSFHMVRATGAADCAAVRSQRATLFPTQ